tara:strand:- start:7937 stop:8329 length:393 start_codon:yes stop_codon:yes gene_type:complete
MGMPFYTYRRESTGEERDIIQTMNETHEYFGDSGDENDWKRVFHAPNASIDSQINPGSKRQFMDSTSTKKGTLGDLMDYSNEMSEKRADLNGGVDPVKQKYFDDYSKKRNGAKHFEEMKSYESKNVKVKY